MNDVIYKHQYLINNLKKQILIEEKIIESFDRIIEICQNTAIKNLLLGCQLESRRHINMCKTLTKIISHTAITDIESKSTKEMIIEHLKLEKEALRNIKESYRKTKNPTVRSLLKKLSSDEERHYKLIEKITGITKPISDDETWQMILSTFLETI